MSLEQSTRSRAEAGAPQPSMRFGLVFGAGGALAWVYHLGVIEGLRASGLVEPAAAGRVVGTSAGAAIGAALLAGKSTDDFLDALAASSESSSGFIHDVLDARTRAQRERRHARPEPQPPSSSPAVNVLRVLGLVALIPGALAAEAVAQLPIGSSRDWDERLWVPAVRVRDGATIVFGRDFSHLAPATGIEASSAVPLIFPPTVIGEESYVDGAVTSGTHADILSDDGHELIIVSAPMSRAGGGWLRARARERMETELTVLRRAQRRTLVLVPDAAVIEQARGYPRQRRETRRLIVDAARRQTLESVERLKGGDSLH